MTKKNVSGFVFILLCFFLSGCPFSPQKTDSENSFIQEGSLQILLPLVAPEISVFNIYGNTADGRSFSRTELSDTSVVLQADLLAGIWTIKVDALNDSDEVVLSGSTTVLLEADDTVSVTIILSDVAGEGTFSFLLEWPSDLFSANSVLAVIESSDGSETDDLVFTVDQENCMAQYSGELPAGFYTLEVSLFEKASKVWGEAYAVQLSVGTETSYTSALDIQDLVLPPGTRIWSFTAGVSLTSSIWSSAAISETGKLYFGADTGRLYALDAETGSQEWSYLTDDRITSSPSIAADGTIYIGSYDGNLYAVDPDTGSLVWSFPTTGWVRSSPAVGSDGTVYFGSNDGYVYAVDPVTGEEIWSFDTGSAVTSSPAVDSSGVVYVGSYNGNVYAIRPDGTQLWVYPTGNWVHSSPAVGSDGTIYVGSYNGLLYALSGENGFLQWSFDAGDWIGSSPVIDDDRSRIYIGTRKGNLYAVDISSGAEIWSFYAGNGGVYSSPAIGDDGVLYFGSYDLNIYAVNPDGTEQWRFKTGLGGISASPLIGPGGKVFVGSRNGSFYALASSSTAPAQSSWPMFHHDYQRSGLAE